MFQIEIFLAVQNLFNESVGIGTDSTSTIFLSHFSATQNPNSCRNSAYMARKKWLDAHTWAYTAPPLLRIPRVQWPASLARRKWKWGLTPSKYYRKATHINSLLSSFRRLNEQQLPIFQRKERIDVGSNKQACAGFSGRRCLLYALFHVACNAEILISRACFNNVNSAREKLHGDVFRIDNVHGSTPIEFLIGIELKCHLVLSRSKKTAVNPWKAYAMPIIDVINAENWHAFYLEHMIDRL